MPPTRRSRVRWLSVAAVLLGAGVIGGCGSNNPSSGTGRSVATRLAPGIRVAQCMRAHGVPNYPDSGVNPGSAITQSPNFARAFRVCGHSLHYGNPPPTPRGMVRQQLAFSQCMRAHGVPNFPDPNASGNIQFPVSSPLPKSPAFLHAANGPCKKYQVR